jgi:hypothetical protein
MIRKNLNIDDWVDHFIKHSLRKDANIKSESVIARLSFYFYILVLAETFNIQTKCSIKEIKLWLKECAQGKVSPKEVRSYISVLSFEANKASEKLMEKDSRPDKRRSRAQSAS